MMNNRLNAYRTMWLIVLYDLPTETKKHRKAASRFRKDIMAYGFQMFQFSAYIRHVMSREQADAYKRKVKKILPSEGFIGIIEITDKQFGNMELFHQLIKKENPQAPVQLQLF
ncbi:MAG: CRISPR-associated endonuclease Cas2 [Saprospiraceae bacterium]